MALGEHTLFNIQTAASKFGIGVQFHPKVLLAPVWDSSVLCLVKFLGVLWGERRSYHDHDVLQSHSDALGQR